MEIKLSKTPQAIVIYKIHKNNHADQTTIDEIDLHGKILIGNFYICNNALVVKDNDNMVLGVFSLDHYYFIKPNYKHNPES